MEEYGYFNSEYFNEEDQKRLARMLSLSRAESGMSQEAVALELKIAKRTLQNWEKGVSSPSLPQAIAWFRVVGVAPMPYFLQFMFPDMEGIKKADADEKIRIEFIKLVESLPAEGIRQLMYLFYGDHGSSPRATMNMVTAHLQCPMRDRYNHANMIISDYKINYEKNQTVQPNHIQPDLPLLERTLVEKREAVIKGKNNYSLVK